MSLVDSAATADRVLSALADQLAVAAQRYDVVAIGGSALLALGLTSRATRDVDLLALVGDAGLVEATELPGPLVESARRVARDFDLPPNWLNAGPAEMMRLGLPDGFAERLERRDYGPSLTVRYASRLDQIHFKLYAVVDQGAGKHEADLRALRPTREELLAAARWSRTHDPSEGYRSVLAEVLAHFGVRDGDIDS